MELTINTLVTLATGESVTGAVVKTRNDKFDLNEKEFFSDIDVFRSQADKDAGKDSVYLFNQANIKNIIYAIPQADLDQAVTDGHFGVVGQNHPTRMKDQLAADLDILSTDISVTSLV